ncbi:hypothetical protein DF19_18850 [Streptomyces olindensis]|nr:hypothetical protein DF19_18850 [Streptomyces olindensis]
MQTVADDVADHERDPGPRQRQHVEPVAAHAGLRGQIAVGDLQRALLGQVPREQAALERHRHAVLARVAARVVDGDGGPRDQLLRQGQLVLVERLRLLVAPEADHAQHQGAGPQRHRDQGVDAVVDDLRRAFEVLRLPAGGLAQPGFQDGPAGGETAALRGGLDEPDPLADGVQRSVLADPAQRRAAQRGGRVRLPAAQHRVEQVHGGEVGEPGHGQLGQLLGRARHIEARPDAHAGVVQHVEPFPRGLGPAGQGAQLGGVAQCGDAAGRAARVVRGPLVDGQEPVTDEVHLVRGDAPGGQQVGGVRVEAEAEDVPALGVGGQPEQPVRLVVGEDQGAADVDDEDALADGVQHGVVVFVHPGHLVRPEAVRLPQQPPAHQRGTRRRQGERRGGGGEEERQLLVGGPADVRRRDARGDQAHDPPVRVLHRHHGLHEGADGALDLLGHGLSGQRRCDRPDEPFADAVRLGVGVADAVGVHDDDEVDLRPFTGGLGPRLQDGRGVGAAQRLDGARRVGEGLRDGEGTVAGLQCRVVPHLQDQRHHGGHDQQQHDHHDQQEHLSGDAAPAQRRPQPRHRTPPRRARLPPLPCGRCSAEPQGRSSPGSTQESDHVPCLHCPAPGGEGHHPW